MDEGRKAEDEGKDFQNPAKRSTAVELEQKKCGWGAKQCL